MQDHRAGLHGPRHSPFLPRRAEQDELRNAAVDVHRNGPTTARSHDDLRTVFVKIGLGRAKCGIEVVIIDHDIEGVEDDRLQKSPLDGQPCTINRFTA